MVLRFDIARVVWIALWCVAVALGQLPWWVVVALLGYSCSCPYTWYSPKVKREIAEYEAKQKEQTPLSQGMIGPAWDEFTKRRDS
jgi:hypothetical protein